MKAPPVYKPNPAGTPALQRNAISKPPSVGAPMAGTGMPSASPSANVVQPIGWGGWAAWATLGVAAGVAAGVGAATLGVPLLGAVAIGAMGSAATKLAYERRTENKIDRDVFIESGESREEIKRDVNSAMRKIQLEFTSGKFKDTKLTEKGRDEPVYALRQWARGTGLGKLIRDWNDSWTLEQTAGLLLDAGSKIKTKPEFTSQLPKEKVELLAPVHVAVRDHDKRFKLQGNSEEAIWARGIESDFRVNAGPSATTATLLNFLSIFPITPEEREAIMQAVILFWRGSVKRTMGDYHTGAEVWMAYTRRLEIEEEERKKRQ
jgi:hypothetical protein